MQWSLLSKRQSLTLKLCYSNLTKLFNQISVVVLNHANVCSLVSTGSLSLADVRVGASDR